MLKSTLPIRTLALLAVTLFAFNSGMKGQQPPSAPGGFVIHRSVRRVILDVVVTDSNGKPVHGLTRDDFTVAEDDRTQRVLSFDVHDLSATTDLPKSPSLPANTFFNLPATPEQGPLYILLYDLVNTSVEDQPRGRAQLVKFIQTKPAGARFAIFVLSDNLHMIQGFTTDQAELFAAIDPSRSRPHLPMIFLYGRNSGQGDSGLMADVFDDLSKYCDGLPGRKNLIWFSGGFPLALFPNQQDGPRYREELRETLDAMARAQIAVYPVDVTGVAANEVYAPPGSTPNGGKSSDARSNFNFGAQSPSANAVTSVGYSLTYESFMTQDQIARVTAGRAFYSRNDIAAELEDATEVGGSYYTLTYSPSNQKYDGHLRNIRIDLARDSYKLDYRHSYYGEDTESDAAAPLPALIANHGRAPAGKPVRPIGDSLYANMQHGAPMGHDLIFRAHLQTVGLPTLATTEQMAELAEQPAYFRIRHHNKNPKPLAPVELQTVSIDYVLSARELHLASPAAPPPALEIAAAAYDADGRMLNGDVENSVGLAQPGNTDASQMRFFRMQQQLSVPLAATSIRFAVRDTSTNRIGVMEVRMPLKSEPQTASSAASTVPPAARLSASSTIPK